MKISIITVCLNAARFIDDCLRSVAEQTYPDIEHIVIDGRSSDTTVAIIRRYPHVTRLVSERDDGIYDAMNKGLDLVTGDYVLFLNADDRFASAASLAKAVAAIKADPGADVYYGRLETRSADGPPEVFSPPPPAEAPRFLITGCLPHQSTLARPAVFARTGRFDSRYRYHADYDWYLRILADPAIDVRLVNQVIGSFWLGGSSSQLAKGQPELYAIQNQSPLYATPEWDKTRIDALQEALLRERLTTARLRDEIRAARQLALGLREAYGPRGMIAIAKTAPAVFRDAVRPAPRRWLRDACARYLPAGVVDVLLRIRSWGRFRWQPDRATTKPRTLFGTQPPQDLP
jgi:glycosyltransferase involved in cell wall biosynthesis